MKVRIVVALMSTVGMLACQEVTSPAHDATSLEAMLAATAPSGTWRFTGSASHYATIQTSFVRSLAHDTLYLIGEATATLRCAAGESSLPIATVNLAGQPSGTLDAPCQLTGSFFGRQTSVSTIEGYISWREAPMAAGLKGSLDANVTTFTATMESRFNVNPIETVAVTFNKQ